eukprot:gene8676-biopygen18144
MPGEGQHRLPGPRLCRGKASIVCPGRNYAGKRLASFARAEIMPGEDQNRLPGPKLGRWKASIVCPGRNYAGGRPASFVPGCLFGMLCAEPDVGLVCSAQSRMSVWYALRRAGYWSGSLQFTLHRREFAQIWLGFTPDPRILVCRLVGHHLPASLPVGLSARCSAHKKLRSRTPACRLRLQEKKQNTQNTKNKRAHTKRKQSRNKNKHRDCKNVPGQHVLITNCNPQPKENHAETNILLH